MRWEEKFRSFIVFLSFQYTYFVFDKVKKTIHSKKEVPRLFRKKWLHGFLQLACRKNARLAEFDFSFPENHDRGCACNFVQAGEGWIFIHIHFNDFHLVAHLVGELLQSGCHSFAWPLHSAQKSIIIGVSDAINSSNFPVLLFY